VTSSVRHMFWALATMQDVGDFSSMTGRSNGLMQSYEYCLATTWDVCHYADRCNPLEAACAVAAREQRWLLCALQVLGPGKGCSSCIHRHGRAEHNESHRPGSCQCPRVTSKGARGLQLGIARALRGCRSKDPPRIKHCCPGRT
jgi:hypothetical protein